MIIDRKPFRAAAVEYFTEVVGAEYVMRIDGIECSPLSKYWFWRLRLDWMVLKGILVRKTGRNVWASADKLPLYGLAKPEESK